MPHMFLVYLSAVSGAADLNCSNVTLWLDGGHWATTQKYWVALKDEKRKCAKRSPSGPHIDLTLLQDPDPGPESDIVEMKFEVHIGGPNGKKIGQFSQFCETSNFAACAKRTLKIATAYR
jgi:hypothetical protein